MVAYRKLMLFLLLAGTLSLSAQEFHLFSLDVHDASCYHQQMVMDFLERYFGRVLPTSRQTTLEHKMADDKVYFRKGCLADLKNVTDTIPFSISLQDNYYEVKWLKQEKPFVTIVFPAQYDLLLGMQKDEALNTLKDAICAAPKRDVRLPLVTDLQMLPDSVWQTKTEHFELESLNDALYYNKVGEEFLPVFNSSHLEYSAANLFNALIADRDYRMYVEQSIYGMKTVNYTLTLQQWLNYCAQLGLKIYFAVEEQRKDGLQAVVIARSREFGFNHLLSIVIPDRFVIDQNSVLKVRLTPYIPTHNVKDLYQKESSTHKRIKRQ